MKVYVNCFEKTLVIEDSGCGMTSEQMQTSLTAWPKSATRNYIDDLNNRGDDAIIPGYHVGFYASYLVAYYVSAVSVRDGQEHRIQ